MKKSYIKGNNKSGENFTTIRGSLVTLRNNFQSVLKHSNLPIKPLGDDKDLGNSSLICFSTSEMSSSL